MKNCGQGEDFYAEFTLSDPPGIEGDRDSIAEKKTAFYYNQKSNASVRRICGDRRNAD